ncbi:uncharacterized protein LOC115564206 [Drosophila navojoa]|nr:uncharacterized protein LOC115564206 [Drosophila navojoa]
MQMKLKIKTMLTANRRLGPHWNLFLCALCASLLDLGCAWKCLYEEFPVIEEQMKGIWFIYATRPDVINRCLIQGMDMYWNRITYTDYSEIAVELHCSLPFFRQQMIVYTRREYPSREIIKLVDNYLKTVKLSIDDFHLVNKETCIRNSKEPIQRWHLSKYQHLGYNPHYLRPLVVDKNI